MEEAVAALEQYLNNSPHSAEACFQLGQAHLYLKSYGEAKRWYEAALKEAPEVGQAYYGLAAACERLGETDKVREYRQKHLAAIKDRRAMSGQRVRQAARDEAEVRESIARAYATAAQVYATQGKTREAEECRSKAAAHDPRYAGPGSLPGITSPSLRSPLPPGR
jgi:tetratricopeptide (TPR) repeat protein